MVPCTVTVGETQRPGNTETRKQEPGPEVGESGGITPELHLIYTHRYIILTGINQVIKIMTIPDKAKSLCKS